MFSQKKRKKKNLRILFPCKTRTLSCVLSLLMEPNLHTGRLNLHGLLMVLKTDTVEEPEK